MRPKTLFPHTWEHLITETLRWARFFSRNSDLTTFPQNSGHDESGVLDSPLDNPRPESHFRWRGTCIHDFETPKWVQKRRRRDPEDGADTAPVYDEPRRAVAVAINGKFSLTAVGTHRSVS
jgi:hypothetical protein